MNELWKNFQIKDDFFRISTNGNLERIDTNIIEIPRIEVINDRSYAMFSTRKIPIVQRMIKEFLGITMLPRFIFYKDGDILNNSCSNILISSQNILDRTGFDCTKRPIDRAIKYRFENFSNLTSAEKYMRNISVQMKSKFEMQPVFFSKKSFYILDFYFSKYKVAIEVDGKHHVDNWKQFCYDISRDEYLSDNYGINTIRIPNDSILLQKYNYQLCEKIKEEILKNRFKEENFCLSNFIKNKIDICHYIIQIFKDFKSEVRELTNEEELFISRMEKYIDTRGILNTPMDREKQLLKVIIYGCLKNNNFVFWKVRELTESCNIVKTNEINFSHKKTITYLNHISDLMYNFIKIKRRTKTASRGTIFDFSLKM